MGQKWRRLDWNDECPSCGCGPESLTPESLEANMAYDGDAVRCEECGHPGSVSADEDEAHINWHDDPNGECCHWCKLNVALSAATQRAADAERERDNLLARIHRDGGHYVQQHGLEKAIEDAHKVSANRTCDLDEAVGLLRESHDQFDYILSHVYDEAYPGMLSECRTRRDHLSAFLSRLAQPKETKP